MNPEHDPRLAEVYDAECTWGPDDDFFFEVASRGTRVLDLGCGTGRLTIALAIGGRDVTGVDPNPTSIAWARAKPGGEAVRWVIGTARDVDGTYDVALMTSHVAQVFIGDDEWAGVLADLHRVLVPGGVLAFDMRNPGAKPWHTWTEASTRGSYELSGGRSVATWVEVDTVDSGVVTFTWANEFSDGAFVGGTTALRFRSEAELRASLTAAGFTTTECYGNFSRAESTPSTPEIVVVARAQ